MKNSNEIGVNSIETFSFYFPDSESSVIVKKKINVETTSSRFQVPGVRKNGFKIVVCSLHSVTVAGDESASGIKMKLWKWDKTRTEMRFFGVLGNKGAMEGSFIGDVLAYYFQIFRNPL